MLPGPQRPIRRLQTTSWGPGSERGAPEPRWAPMLAERKGLFYAMLVSCIFGRHHDHGRVALTQSAATPGQWCPICHEIDSRRWLTRLVKPGTHGLRFVTGDGGTRVVRGRT